MVYRVHKTNDYTAMSNHHLKNKDLSLKAKGLLSVMLSLPDDWDYSIQGLVAISKENITTIENTLKELRDNRYLVVTKKLPNETKSGRIEYEYDIYEKPQKQGVEKQGVEKLPLEIQGVEKQGVENHPQLNTKELSTKELNTKYINIEFEKLWELYPRKQGKKDAFNHYKSARKNGTTYEEVEKGLKDYLSYIKVNNIEPRYIKNGSTWFNQHWTDEYETLGNTFKSTTPSYDSDKYKEKARSSIEYKPRKKTSNDFDLFSNGSNLP